MAMFESDRDNENSVIIYSRLSIFVIFKKSILESDDLFGMIEIFFITFLIIRLDQTRPKVPYLSANKTC